MATLVSDFIQERCGTVGTGDLLLTGAVDTAQASFSDNLPAGSVWYSIFENGNREVGEGHFNGVSTITRTRVDGLLLNGVWTSNPEDLLGLEGESVVSCTLNATAYNDLIAEVETLRLDVDNNTDSILALESNENSLEPRVAQNEINIAGNTAATTINSADIATNTSDLAILDADVSFRESAITALETGGLVSGNGPTSVLIAAGNGEIIDSYSDTEDQDVLDVTWSEQTLNLLAVGGMPVVSGIGYTEIGIGDSRIASVYPNGLSPSQRRGIIRLAGVEYLDRVITRVNFIPIVSNQVGNTLVDLIDVLPRESKLKGLLLRPTTAVDLGFWRDSGQLFGIGVNYVNAKDNQNILQILAAGDSDTGQPYNPVTFNNGVTGTGVQAFQIPNDAYEPGGNGSVDVIPNNNAVIHYMFQTLGGNFYLSYGQQGYAGGYTEATGKLFADKAEHLFAAEFSSLILLAQIVVTKNAASFDSIVAGIFPLGSSTTAGSGGGSAGDAINISYTDTYNLGVNVQTALDSLGAIKLSPDQYQAVIAANLPSNSNPFATIADILGSEEGTVGPAINTVGKPLTDIPLTNSFSILKGAGSLFFTRNSVATYIDLYGDIRIADVDAPRLEASGLLIEPSAANLVLQSVELDTDLAEWDIGANITRIGRVNSPVVDSEVYNNAYRYTGVTATSGASISQSVALTATRDYIASIWLRSSDPGAILTGSFTCDSISTPLAGEITSDWKRFEVLFTSSASNITILPFADISVGASIDAWGAQVEGAPVATSLIPTESTTGTRKADDCELSYAGNIPDISNNWSIAIDVDLIQLNGTERQVAWACDFFRLITPSNTDTFTKNLTYANGNSDIDTGVQLVPGTVQRIVLTVDGTNDRVYVDGDEVYSQASGPAPTEDSNHLLIRLGRYDAFTGHLQGHLKNIRVYNTTLTAFEAGMA